MEVQWYPGHMTKALRQMKEDLSLIDIVIEVCDARIPRSSRNPDIDTLAAGKGRIVLLSKSDLADARKTDRWMAHFKERGILVVAADLRGSGYLRQVQGVLEEAGQEKRARDKKRGIKMRPLRAMVAGIPNSGKSTFINSFAKNKSAKTGNKPGVTKGKQWIHASAGVDLLDTPGILYPKFEDRQVGVNLAICGSINDQILDITELAGALLHILAKDYAGDVLDRYGIAGEKLPENAAEAQDFLTEIAARRGFWKSGGEADTEKSARVLIDEFRRGACGRITLEEP